MQKKSRATAIVVSVMGLALVVSACGSSKSSTASSSTDSGKSGKVALLLPESKTARYESQDKPLFTAKLKSLCSGCELIYNNANQSSATQQSQAESALTNGAKVLVLDPVDAVAAAQIVTKATAQNVPVISYDRLIQNVAVKYYISFDNEQVGVLQGQALLDKLTALGTVNNGSVIMINGSPTDSNAALFKKGAHSVLDNKVKIAKQEYDTPEWSADNAQAEMTQAITAVGKANIIGVYAANDGTAGGAIAAMKAAGFTTLPPVTGQDAEVAGIQRVIAGQQYMTIYKAVKLEAEEAATLASQIAKGETPDATTKTSDNKSGTPIPSFLFPPVAVTAQKTATTSSVKDTIIKDGFETKDQICTADYASFCTTLGIS